MGRKKTRPAARLDPVRKRLLRLQEAKGSNLRTASVAMGRNDAYLQQFIYGGTPKVLAEDDREILAEHLGCRPELLKHGRSFRLSTHARRPPPSDAYAAPVGYSAVPEADVRMEPDVEAWNGELRVTGTSFVIGEERDARPSSYSGLPPYTEYAARTIFLVPGGRTETMSASPPCSPSPASEGELVTARCGWILSSPHPKLHFSGRSDTWGDIPANLFYGTGIPACIGLPEMEASQHRGRCRVAVLEPTLPTTTKVGALGSLTEQLTPPDINQRKPRVGHAHDGWETANVGIARE